MDGTTLVSTLTNVVEKLQENYTCERLFASVDSLLYQALFPVIAHTRLMDEFLARYHVYDTKKTLYHAKTEEFERALYLYSQTDDRHQQLELVRGMKLNRELVALVIQRFVEPMSHYLEAVSVGSPTAAVMRASWLCREINSDMVLPLMWAAQRYRLYMQIREEICEKYYRYIIRDITRWKYLTGDRINMNDMAEEYLDGLYRAFGRYNSSSGAFAGYIANYFKSARATSTKVDETGTAFQIPGPVRSEIAQGKDKLTINFATSLDASEVELASIDPREEDDSDTDIDNIRALLAHVDPKGWYSAVNGIPQPYRERFQLG